MAVINKDLLSLKDIADFCNTSSTSVSNWRTRDKDHERFPLPYQEISGTPLWKPDDIIEFLKIKFGDDFDVIATGNMTKKTIAVTGRPKGGKSFFSSRMVKDKTGFMRLFCGNASDKTACPIYIKISDYTTTESFVFHSDFNSIYSEDQDEDILKVKARVSALVNSNFQQSDIDKMHEIEDTIWMMREIEKRFENRRDSDTYIDTYQKPSEFTARILRKYKLGSIEIIDTPGVAGKVDASRIAKSDIYFFLLKSDNSDEAETIKSIVDSLKADIATSKAAFLYKKEGYFITEKKYDEARTSVREDMKAYNDLFADLRKNIISTELDLCDPAEHCIVFPTMDAEDMTLAEEQFLKDIGEKLDEAFQTDTDEIYDKKYHEVIEQYGQTAKDFAIKVLSDIPKHDIGNGDKVFSTEDVVAGHHDRVMTGDNYMFHSDLRMAYKKESNLLEQYFSQFKIEDYKESWQQVIIKYLYRKLSSSVRTDRGLGIGIHPWEEKPARTMLVEESIFADSILAAISGVESNMRNIPYRNALRSNNIESATWNCVACTDDNEALLKLDLVKDSLLNVKVSSRQEMVLCRYVGGLRKVAEYEVIKKMGYSDSETKGIVKALSF